MGDMFYGKVIVIADLTQAGNTVTFTSGSTVLTATVGADGIAQKILPALNRWEVELDDYVDYVDLGCGECKSVNLALTKSTWQGIQNILDAHKENELLSIGDEIHISIQSEDYVYQVGGIDLYDAHEVIFVPKTVIGTTMQHRSSATNDGGWKESKIRDYLNGDFKNLLPDAVKNNLKSFTMRTSTGQARNDVQVTEDYIWLPREYEVRGAIEYSAPAERDYCVQYPIFAGSVDKIIRTRKSDGSAVGWWHSSPLYNSTSSTYTNAYFCNAGSMGGADYNSATVYTYILPCFRFTANQ